MMKLPDFFKLNNVTKHSFYVIFRQVPIEVHQSFFVHVQAKVSDMAVKDTVAVHFYSRYCIVLNSC